MHAHDEHGSRVFFRGPQQATAHELWRAQRELEEIGRRTAIHAAENPATARAAMLANWAAEAQEAFGGRVFRIPNQTLGELTRRIEQLDRRARKLGTGSIRLHDTGETDPGGRTFLVLRGEAPVLAGWTLAAIVAHRDEHAALRPLTERGARLRAVAFARARCEHCGLRRRRTETFVVMNTTTGEGAPSGLGLPARLLGGHDPDRACRQAEDLALARGALDEADRLPPVESVRAGAPEMPLEQFVAHATRGSPLRVGEVVALRGLVERHTRFGPTAVTVLSHCRRGALDSANHPARREAAARRPVT